MSRPLWAILFGLSFAAFGVARVATGTILYVEDAPLRMVLIHATQALLGLAAGWAIWFFAGKEQGTDGS